MRKTILPTLILPSLLVSVSCGIDWTVTGQQTQTLTGGQTIDKVDLRGQGNLIVNSSGTNTIKQMSMFWLNAGAGATFNVNGGKLNLDLALTNMAHVKNHVDFNLNGNSTLELDNGKNGKPLGIFQGINTELKVTLQGNSTFKGHLSNDGKSNIKIDKGSTLEGNLTQNGGTLDATIEGKLKGSITLTKDVTKTSLWANQNDQNINTQTATITGNISQEGGQLEGIMKGLKLEGSFTQTGGTSDIAFHSSVFENTTTLNGGNATLHLYDTKIKSISSSGGVNTINLKGHQNTHANGSHMEGYTGINSQTTINLIEKSSMQSASQTEGSLTIKANDSKIDGSVTGDRANLDLTLSQSKLTGSVSNIKGTTNVDASNASTIGGNITQTKGKLQVSLNNSTLEGQISQTEGQLLKIKAIGSTIKQGISLSKVSNTNPKDDVILTNSTVNNGLRLDHLASVLMVTMQGSTINGGYHQEGEERVVLNGSGSHINGGVQVKNGPKADYMTYINFSDNSSIKGGITATNHSLKVMLSNNSSAADRITITGGSGYIAAQHNSTFTGDLISQDTTSTELHLNDRSKLIGNVNQSKGQQKINLTDGSMITGSIHNINVTNSIITLDTNSELKGSLTQDGGKLFFGLGGNSTVHGDVLLNNAQTTLSNGKTQVPAGTIKGNLTQNGGTLDGRIEGLTLEGFFKQNGGSSDITFLKANFRQPTSINGAIASHVIFTKNSNLKSYTITDSANTFLKLNFETTLDGDFKLVRSNSKLSVLNNSKITGSVISKDPKNNLELEMDNGGTIEGDLDVEGGTIKGNLNGGNINGNINIKDADSKLDLKNSTIGGNIHIIKGTNIITLDNTKVGGWFKMEEKGPTQPTLKLKISNGSSIGGDLTFLNTTAYLGGEGLGSTIKGNLVSEDSTLENGGATGWIPISGLTIEQDFKQNKGTLDLTFTNKSHILGETILKDSAKSHITMKDSSSINKITVSNIQDALISLWNESKQTGGITLTDSKVKLEASNRSSITGDIEVISNNNFASKTEVYLKDQSTLTGNITQNSGSLLVDLQNTSKMQGNITVSNLDSATLNLNQQSAIKGTFTVLKTETKIKLDNQSSADLSISSTAMSSFDITVDHGSTLSGDITHIGVNRGQYDLSLKFNNNSFLENKKMSLVGQTWLHSNLSTINSEEIELITGKFDLYLDRSGGTITKLSSAGSNSIQIQTTNSSDSAIETLKISDQVKLSLLASKEARISGHLLMSHTSEASLTSIGNANIAFDITPQDNAKLDISLNGGKLQGKITQNAPDLGNAVLGGDGRFGGRWIMTDDSALKSLMVDNAAAHIQDRGLMQQDVANSKISMVDMTKDALGASRIGKALVPQATVAQNQTKAKTLSLSSLGGLNGVFRLYTDIGANLSDKVVAQTASGNHIIQAYYNPATFTQDLTGKYIVLAHVDDPNTTVSFEGADTEVGTQVYKTELTKVNAQGGNGFDWILGSMKHSGNSYGTKVIASIMQSQYRAFAIQTETLNERLGELRNINRMDGIWARYKMGETQTKESPVHVPLKDQFYSTWFGYDQNTLDLKGQNFLGFALSYTQVNPNGKDYTGSIHNIGFNFYDVFVARNDFYVDVVAKYILSYGTYEIFYPSLSRNAPEYINHKLMINLEIGKKFKLGQGRKNYFYLKPEAQITSGYIHGNEIDFIDLTDTLIHAQSSYHFPVILRAGLTAAYAMQHSSFEADFRFGSSLIYELKNGGDVRLDDGNSVVKYGYKGDFHLLFQAGANFIVNQAARIYLEASTGFLGATSINYGINAGVRFVFGPKNTRRLKVPSLTPPPPPPEPEYDPRNIPVIADNTKSDIRSNNGVKASPYDSDYFINTRKNFRDQTSLRK